MTQEKTIHYEEEKNIKLPVHRLWELLSDSNHLNHYIGLFPVKFSEFQKAEGRLYRTAEARAFGVVPVKWKEQTFSWVRDQWYEIERIYESGPVERVIWQVHTKAINEETSTLKLKGVFHYRNAIGRLMLSNIIIPKLKKTFDYATSFENARKETIPRPQKNERIEVDRNMLETRVDKLKQEDVASEIADQLKSDILQLNNEEVSAIRPYAWAKIYGYNRRETVRLFLLATKTGVLEQHWNLLCPNCRVPKTTVSSMKDIPGQVHCDLCGMDFDIDFDRLIEMQFRPHASIRTVTEETYCINGPMNATHIIAQFRMSPGTSEMTLPSPETPVRFRVLGHNFTAAYNEDPAEKKADMAISMNGFNADAYAPGETLVAHNRTDEEIVLVLEETKWDDDALTARELTSLQLFRDLFSAEVLSPDQEIHVSNMTILFTDLKESTSMYEKIGDAPAYADVRKHFDFVRERVQNADGAIVKTIGDSVMAAFTREKDAFHAAMDVQAHIDELRLKVEEPLRIKIGMQSGPVIAVNANGLLDYFGRTVNLAARIEQESDGDDIVLSSDMFDTLSLDPEEWGETWETDRNTANLHGFEEEIELVHVKRKVEPERLIPQRHK